MKRFTMFMITTLLAIGSMVAQTSAFAFVVYDASLYNPLFGGGEMDGATVELSNDSYSYSATSATGFADFAEVVYGEYTYTVSAIGFASQTGTFTVDANTASTGGLSIQLQPASAFAFVVYNASLYNPLFGGGELDGATVELTNDNYSYSATSAAGFADFAEVVYGEYNYTVSATGFASQTGTFTVDANTASTGGLSIQLQPASAFAFVVYNASLYNPLFGGGELDGANVELTNDNYSYSATSAAGFADFAEVVYGEYNYTVSATGFASQTGTFTVDANTASTGGLSIQLQPASAFAFVVYNASLYNPLFGGGELDGANVELTNDANTYSATSAVGFADFAEVVYGEYTYTVSATGFASQTGTFTVDANTASTGGLSIQLEPASAFAFVVYDASLYNPLFGGGEMDGATVELTNDSYSYSATSAAGFADFAEVVYGEYTYTVSATGFASQTGTFTVDANTASTGGLSIQLQPASAFAFVVYDASLYNPLFGGGELDGATVELSNDSYSYSATSATGFADFAEVVYGEYTYTVSATGFASQTGTFTVDANTASTGGLSIQLEPTSAFAFVVYDASQYNPLMGGGEMDGATVELSNDSYTYSATSATGFADFSEVVYGEYTYTVSATGFASQTGTFTVDANTATTGGLMIYLEPASAFAFVVYDASQYNPLMGGGEMDGATVELSNDSYSYSATSAVGFADFAEVVYGEYTYTVSATGFASQTGTFTVDANTATTGGLMIYLEPASAFAFVVYDASQYNPLMGGGEMDGATVELSNDSYSYSATSATGYADFSEVVYGEYTYTVSATGFASQTGTFTVDANTASTGGLSIQLQPASAFAFVVYDASLYNPLFGGGEMDGATVELTNDNYSYSATSAAGFADFAEVVYGEYTYTVSANGFASQTGTFTVDANTASTGGLSIQLQPTSAFAFVVYDASLYNPLFGGGELDGATVELTNDSYSYSATSATGFADFAEVVYGEYTYTVSATGFTSQTGTFTVDANTASTGGLLIQLEPVPTSIDKTNSTSVTIYPNPATSFINVELGNVEEKIIISVLNSNGSVINQYEATGSVNRIDINGLSSGVYFININGGGYSKTIKFIKP